MTLLQKIGILARRSQVGPGEWYGVVWAEQKNGTHRVIRRFVLYLEGPPA